MPLCLQLYRNLISIYQNWPCTIEFIYKLAKYRTSMSIQLNNVVTKGDHVLGIDIAPLALLEYGDYQCPSSGDSYMVVKEVLRELGNDVVFIFRNFPLTDIHPDAFEAALAAEAAALQNKFWGMYDSLYQHQANLSSQDLFQYAEAIGLEMGRFEKDTQSQSLISKIEADLEGGLRSGVTGTPTFYVNGTKYEGNWEGDLLIQHLKSRLYRLSH